MYLEAELARKLFLPYEIKKFQRKKKIINILWITIKNHEYNFVGLY